MKNRLNTCAEVIEQLEEIKINSEEMRDSGNYTEDEENPWALDVEAIDTAIPILKKSIHQKPKEKIGSGIVIVGKCPCCENFVNNKADRHYCQCCGQHLDWSEEK